VSAPENDATEAAHREKEVDRTDDEHGDQWAPDQSNIGAAEEYGLSERHSPARWRQRSRPTTEAPLFQRSDRFLDRVDALVGSPIAVADVLTLANFRYQTS
jgi:hypothetical protein